MIMKNLLAVFLSAVTALAMTTPITAQEWKREELETPLRGIGTVLIRSHNPELLAAYYRTLGFKDWRRSERIIGFHVGGGEGLEIGYLDEGIEPAPIRTSRTEIQGPVPVFGTHDIEGVLANAEANGALFIEPVGPGDRIDLYYIADPEGNVFGFQERAPMFGDDMEIDEGVPSWQTND